SSRGTPLTGQSAPVSGSQEFNGSASDSSPGATGSAGFNAVGGGAGGSGVSGSGVSEGDGLTGSEVSGTAPGGSACRQVIKIGVSYSSDTAAAGAAVGNPTAAASLVNYANEVRALDQRVADYVNAHGGLAGCEVALVYHDFHLLGASGFSGESESECVDF